MFHIWPTKVTKMPVIWLYDATASKYKVLDKSPEDLRSEPMSRTCCSRPRLWHRIWCSCDNGLGDINECHCLYDRVWEDWR